MTYRTILRATVVLLGAIAACSRTPIDESPRRDAETEPAYTGYPRVSVGGAVSCLLEASGHATCWGNTLKGQWRPPDARFSALDVGGLYGCGLLADGTPKCWPGGQGPAPTPAYPPEGKYRKISVGGTHACGIRLDDSLVCWGNPTFGETDAPSGRFRDVSAGSDYSCAVRADGSAVCWGSNKEGKADAPGGYFLSVQVGTWHACGLIDGELVRCWGWAELFAPLQNRRVRSLAVGDNATCAILFDGSVECAGRELQARPPSGKFVQIDLGEYHGCGVRPGGAIECWGVNEPYGQATPPSR